MCQKKAESTKNNRYLNSFGFKNINGGRGILETDDFKVTKETHYVPTTNEMAGHIEAKIEKIGDIFKGLKEASVEDVSELFNEVLTHNFHLGPEISNTNEPISFQKSSFMYLPDSTPFVINKDEVSFRIRNDETMLGKSPNEITVQDFWNAPREHVDLGRLNKKNESMLYIANSPLTSIKEMGMKTDDVGYLSLYSCEENITLRVIGDSRDKIGELMFNLFSEKVAINTNDKYKLTQEIANRYFAKIESDDGWVYPSVADLQNSFCATIDEESLYKLSFYMSLKIKIINEQLAKVERVFFLDDKGKLHNIAPEIGRTAILELNDPISFLRKYFPQK